MTSRSRKSIAAASQYLLLAFLLLFPAGRGGRFGNGRDCSFPDQPQAWTLGPFAKQDSANPILGPSSESTFLCPVHGSAVHWEGKFVFNPAAAVRNDTVFLLYRAEDGYWGRRSTSRIGLAWSADGIHFERRNEPVLYPDNDMMKRYEWEGGCEDPRIVEDGRGGYVLTYTAWNRDCARLCVATSRDLVHWRKEGPAFDTALGGRYRDIWSKSGSIVCELRDGHFVAKTITRKYWMYWGESDIFLAWSRDLIHWVPVEKAEPSATDNSEASGRGRERLLHVLKVRHGMFDSGLVEPGPPAMATHGGILLLYNSRNTDDNELPQGTYAAGQALFDSGDPAKLIDRAGSWFIRPEREYELSGQVNNVCFIEGLVYFRHNYFLYYGTADTKIAVATTLP